MKVTPELKERIEHLCRTLKAAQVSRRLHLSIRTVYRHGGHILQRRALVARRQRERRDRQIVERVVRGERTAVVANAECMSRGNITRIVDRLRPEGYSRSPGCTWETSPTRKLEVEEAVEIIDLQGKQTAAEIAARFGITRQCVYGIWKRRRWPAAWRIYDERATRARQAE